MRKNKKGRKTMKSAAPFEPVEKRADVERADVYLPKPAKELVDRVELRHELMRRFSKTLAELAK
jgi:hypothetical protein